MIDLQKIEILGTNCVKCRALEDNLNKVLKELNIETGYTKTTDVLEIIKRGVVFSPALVINGEIKSTGQALTESEIKDIFDGKEIKKEEICDFC